MRGLAVLAVLLFHAGVGWAGGGFLGVDAFFVLSGYLITRLLLEECASTGRLDLVAFWLRRARRLFPALALVLLAVCGYAAVAAQPDTLHSLRLDLFAALAYVANWRQIAHGSGYFDRFATPSPLQHTWSLAIEEQFYLLWPLILLLLLGGGRFATRRVAVRRVAAVSLSGAAISALLMALLYSPSDPGRVYYGTDTRAQSILIGAALAALLAGVPARPARRHPGAPRLLPALGVAGAVGCGWACTSLTGTSTSLYHGMFGLFALGVAALLAAVVSFPRGWTARLLGMPPLAGLGRISYGVYLWHWPLFQVVDHQRTGLAGSPLLVVRLVATLAIAALSYTYVEAPLMRGASRRAFAFGLPVVTGVVVAATVAATAAPVVSRLPAGTSAASPAAAVSSGLPGPAVSRWEPWRPAIPGSAAASGRRDGATPIAVFGDSVAVTLATGLAAFGPAAHALLRDDAVLGCGLVRGGPYRYFGSRYAALPQCQGWPQQWSAEVARQRPAVVLLLAGRWEVMDRFYAGRWRAPGDPVFDHYLAGEIDRAVAVLSSNGARVALATAPYYLRGERPDGGTWPEDDPRRVDAWNALLRQAAARHPDSAAVVELGSRITPGRHYSRYVDGVAMRYDGVHLTPAADRMLAPWLLPRLVSLAR